MSKTIRALKAWKNVVITATYKGASVTKNVSVLFTLGADCHTDSSNPTMIYMYDTSASSPYKQFLNYWDSSSYNKNTFLINCYESGTQNSSTKIAASNFNYTSSNPSVASVNASGVVTYVGNGTATITVTAKSSSNYIGTKVFYVKCQKDGWTDGEIYREPGRVGVDDYEVDIYGTPEFDYLEFTNGADSFLPDGTNQLMGGVSVVNLVDFYIHLDSGFDMSITSYEMAGPVGISIQSQYNSTNTNQPITRYHLSYEDEYSGIFRVSHDNMGTNLGIDYVVLKVYNAREQEDTGSGTYITQTFDSLSNYLITTDKYKNTSGTPGYNTVYGTPSCSIVTDQLTAAGGSFYVNCSVTDSTNWYYRYESGAYSSLQSGSQAGTAKWRITASGYRQIAPWGGGLRSNNFTHPTSGDTTLNIPNVGNKTVYPTGSSYPGTHDHMSNACGTDYLQVTAYNVNDPSKSKTSSEVTITNNVETLTLTPSKNPIIIGEVTTAPLTAIFTSGTSFNVASWGTFSQNPTGIVGIDPKSLRIAVDDFENGDNNLIHWIGENNNQGHWTSDTYAYTGQTIQYNNKTMYVWKQIEGDISSFVTFALTETIDFDTLYEKSLYYNVSVEGNWTYGSDIDEHPVIICSGDYNTVGGEYVSRNGFTLVNIWTL